MLESLRRLPGDRTGNILEKEERNIKFRQFPPSLAGLSAEELVAQLRERGIVAEVGSVTVELPELNISFFFFEDVPRTISWQTPEAF